MAKKKQAEEVTVPPQLLTSNQQVTRNNQIGTVMGNVANHGPLVQVWVDWGNGLLVPEMPNLLTKLKE